jgi:GNAT superfamily N-acetyltransferase
MSETSLLREATYDDLPKGLWKLVNVFRFKDDPLVDGLPLKEQQDLFRDSLDSFSKVYVVENSEGRVIGAAKLLIEEKLHHRGRAVGHIEDLSVDPGCQGQGIGSLLVEHLKEEARKFGVYKLLLNATEEVHGFYLKNGFKIHGYEMGIRF